MDVKEDPLTVEPKYVEGNDGSLDLNPNPSNDGYEHGDPDIKEKLEAVISDMMMEFSEDYSRQNIKEEVDYIKTEVDIIKPDHDDEKYKVGLDQKNVKYNCDLCDYRATTKVNIKRHLQSIHEGVKYSCKQCEFKATQKKNVKRHVKSVHEGVQYNCDLCDYEPYGKTPNSWRNTDGN